MANYNLSASHEPKSLFDQTYQTSVSPNSISHLHLLLHSTTLHIHTSTHLHLLLHSTTHPHSHIHTPSPPATPHHTPHPHIHTPSPPATLHTHTSTHPHTFPTYTTAQWQLEHSKRVMVPRACVSENYCTVQSTGLGEYNIMGSCHVGHTAYQTRPMVLPYA